MAINIKIMVVCVVVLCSLAGRYPSPKPSHPPGQCSGNTVDLY
jgi:hypothetical protein